MNLAEQRRIQAQEVSAIFQTIDQTQIDALVDAIMQTDRIFISGWGRAGNVARILGMNCSQLGKLVSCHTAREFIDHRFGIRKHQNNFDYLPTSQRTWCQYCLDFR